MPRFFCFMHNGEAEYGNCSGIEFACSLLVRGVALPHSIGDR